MKLLAMLLGMGLFSSTPMSCNKGNAEDAAKDTLLAQLDLKNVFYGSDTAQNMDIYLPEGRDTTNTKIVLFIHGGSWNSGDKRDFNEAISAIHKQLPDYAIFNMNYRLANNNANRFPAAIKDVQSAIDFISFNAPGYNINANKFCLIGASAGGHLALLQAYKNNSDGKVKAVIDLFGPTDLTDFYNNHPIPAASRPVLVNFLGTKPSNNADLYVSASPVSYATHGVPTKIFHGAADVIVPIKQSKTLKARLQANNIKVEMITYEGEGHGWYGNNLLDTYSQTVKFIKENVF
jgi:acetyl esterase/lipase